MQEGSSHSTEALQRKESQGVGREITAGDVLQKSKRGSFVWGVITNQLGRLNRGKWNCRNREKKRTKESIHPLTITVYPHGGREQTDVRPEYPVGIHADTKRTCKLHIEWPWPGNDPEPSCCETTVSSKALIVGVRIQSGFAVFFILIDTDPSTVKACLVRLHTVLCTRNVYLTQCFFRLLFSSEIIIILFFFQSFFQNTLGLLWKSSCNWWKKESAVLKALPCWGFEIVPLKSISWRPGWRDKNSPR